MIDRGAAPAPGDRVSRGRRGSAAVRRRPASMRCVMNFGLLHLARPDAAIAEAYRVLRPGGRYALHRVGGAGRGRRLRMALRAIEKFGNTDVPLPDGPPFFRFSDPAGTRAHARARRLHRRRSCRSCRWSGGCRRPTRCSTRISRGGVRTAAVLRAQTPEALDSIRDAVRDEVRAVRGERRVRHTDARGARVGSKARLDARCALQTVRDLRSRAVSIVCADLDQMTPAARSSRRRRCPLPRGRRRYRRRAPGRAHSPPGGATCAAPRRRSSRRARRRADRAATSSGL